MATTAAASTAASALSFIPRAAFDASQHLPRSYFLGHHHSGLQTMRRILSNIGLIIECRDFRVPISSWNPLLESSLGSTAERARIIVYTKRDLGPGGAATADVVRALASHHSREAHADAVLFLGSEGGATNRGKTSGQLLDAIRAVARRTDSLTGLRALVVGMPNAGKSTLLNRLRARGMGLPKAAATGDKPGVTRRLGTPVRVIPASGDGGGGRGDAGVMVLDTPGVFIPYVPDAETMLRLALVGCVDSGIVPAVTLADYLLYHINRRGLWALYAAYCPPTNDVNVFLDAVARRTGRLGPAGRPVVESAADWIVTKWRHGAFGRFVLDDVTPDALADAKRRALEPPLSLNQARKREKEARKARSTAKHLAAVEASREG